MAVWRRGTGRETGEYELNCFQFQQGKEDCAQLRMRHQISFLTGRSYCLSQQQVFDEHPKPSLLSAEQPQLSSIQG